MKKDTYPCNSILIHVLFNKSGQIEKNEVPANRSQTIPAKNTNFPKSKYHDSIGKCVIKKVKDKDTQILKLLRR